MKNLSIKEADLQKIQNTSLGEKYWIFELGVAYAYFNVPDNIRFAKPYPEIGKIFWNKIDENLQALLCKDGKPKETMADLINGEERTLIEAILSVIVSTYDITLAIAIPITALIMKKGLLKFCSKGSSDKFDEGHIKELLEGKKIEDEAMDLYNKKGNKKRR